MTTVPATNKQKGEERRSYTCEACGIKGEFVRILAMYDSVRYDEDGTPKYYNDSSSSDSGGSSDGGGGGGADW